MLINKMFFWGNGAEESGEKWREICQQRSGGVGGREYLSGWHSNAVSINVPGHLLNQATAVRQDGIQRSLSYSGHSLQQKHRETQEAAHRTAKKKSAIRIAGESSPFFWGGNKRSREIMRTKTWNETKRFQVKTMQLFVCNKPWCLTFKHKTQSV